MRTQKLQVIFVGVRLQTPSEYIALSTAFYLFPVNYQVVMVWLIDLPIVRLNV